MSGQGSVREERLRVIRNALPSPLSTINMINSNDSERVQSILSILNKILKLCSELLSDINISDDNERRIIITESLDDLDVLKEYIWEQLNIGHWKQVPLFWRSLFSYVSLFKVILICAEDHLPLCDAVKECDVGLLLGEPILDNLLSKLAFKLHVLLQANSSCSRLQCNDEGIHNLQDPKDRKQSHLSDTVQQRCSDDLLPEEGNVIETDNILPNQYNNRLYIDTMNKPSIEKFVQDYFNPQKPALLTHIIDHWPAMTKWNVEYIRRHASMRTIPIEIGSKYTSEEWTQKLVTMEHFIDNFILVPSSLNSPIGYLAQHQLFHQIPELMEDIRIPEYCYVGSSSNIDINAWFGPSNTVTPTHYDPKHNLLCQIFGSKVIRLFPPSDWTFLYPYDADSLLFNTSQVDVEDPNVHIKFPKFPNAKYMDILLKPGMVLYMPPKWAHFVKSLAPSFSISYWFE